MIEEPEPLAFGGVLHWLGDEASVDILQIENNRPPKTVADQMKILDMIHMSFERPQFILDSANRTPNAALTLLSAIEAAAADAAVKSRVSAARSFVLYSTTKPLHTMEVDPTRSTPPGPPLIFPPK
jgi:hypothetical protein